MKRLLLSLCAALALAGCMSTEKAEKKPGTEYLGADVLWRPREWLVFNMLNTQGKEFELTFTVRDMNTYIHGPAPVFFFVVGPDSRILARKFLEDDGVTNGNFKYQDGVYDPFADFRYRQWHRANSPNGVPPEKERSPYLKNPEKLQARTVTMKVPAAGKGIYRVAVVGRWDHWISVDSSLPMPTGITPGAGPLYVHGATLAKSYFYVPKQAQDIGLMLTEEVPPYNAGMTLKKCCGKVVKSVKASGFATYIAITPDKKDTVYQLDIKHNTPGVCLHGKGFPFVMCPDAATAKALRGGMMVDAKGNDIYHQCTLTIANWLNSLQKKDLVVNVKPNKQQRNIQLEGRGDIGSVKVKLWEVEKLLESQDIDPKSKDFGKINYKKIRGNKAMYALALAAASKVKGNVYYGNPAIIRRVLLTQAERIKMLTPELRFEQVPMPWKKKDKLAAYFDLPGRSNWYGLGLDARNAYFLKSIKDVASKGLPPKVIEAWKNALRIWAAGRANMHVGEVANQWGWNYMVMKGIYEATGDKEIKDLLLRHGKLVSAPGLHGRLNPDKTPFDRRVGYLDTDCGGTESGYMPEQMGFDGEYSCEQTLLWREVWHLTKQKDIVDWFNRFNILKTFLTLPRDAAKPRVAFSETSSPTDLNFRTRYMTMKNHQPKELVGQIDYLDLWFPPKDNSCVKPWPCMEKGDFAKIIGKKFYFIKDGDYYAILYGGPRLPIWANWSEMTQSGDSANFDGPAGAGYGSWGRSANKPGGISALWVKGCGIVSLGQNHTVRDTNTVWGHALKPLYKVWRDDVDPTEFAACYGQPDVVFDPASKIYQITESIPDVPVAVRREMKFERNRIKVKVEVEALEDYVCKDLNYSIPFYSDNRIVSAFLKGKKVQLTIPKALKTPTRPKRPTASIEVKRLANPTVTVDRLSVTAKNGAGVEYNFNAPFKMKVLTPFRYRPQQSAGGAFMLSLPNKLHKNQKIVFTYIIKTI